MKMAEKKKRFEHSPTLNTVLMVEDTLKSSNESVLKISELKRKLPKQINHNMLKTILEYLEESNKIAVSLKGITWVHNTSPRMKAALRKGYDYPEEFSK